MEIPRSVFVAVYPYRHSKMRVVGTSLQPSLQIRQIAEKITRKQKAKTIYKENDILRNKRKSATVCCGLFNYII